MLQRFVGVIATWALAAAATGCSVVPGEPPPQRVNAQPATLSAELDMPVVPSRSVLHLTSGDFVFVVDDDTGRPTATLQQVSVGAVRNFRAAIGAGIEPGALVVTAGMHTLRNGSPVRVHSVD